MDKAGDVLANPWFLDLPAFPLDLSNAQLSTIRGLVILGDEKIAAGADGHYAAAVQVAIWQTGYAGGFTSDFNDPGLVSQVLVDGEHTDDKHKARDSWVHVLSRDRAVVGFCDPCRGNAGACNVGAGAHWLQPDGPDKAYEEP
jgi:hypothetical protein